MAATGVEDALTGEVTRRYDLHSVELVRLDVPVNDVVAVTAEEGDFALKLYHRARTSAAVRCGSGTWSTTFIAAARRWSDRSPGRLLQCFVLDGRERFGGLFTWALGTKPAPGPKVYHRLGAAAGIRSWLEGYRTVRRFGPADEAAVAVFGIVGDLQAVAWQLGVAVSSRGALIDAALCRRSSTVGSPGRRRS